MKSRYFRAPSKECGVLAQLVERLNGIEEVRGSNPLGSIRSKAAMFLFIAFILLFFGTL